MAAGRATNTREDRESAAVLISLSSNELDVMEKSSLYGAIEPMLSSIIDSIYGDSLANLRLVMVGSGDRKRQIAVNVGVIADAMAKHKSAQDAKEERERRANKRALKKSKA